MSSVPSLERSYRKLPLRMVALYIGPTRFEYDEAERLIRTTIFDSTGGWIGVFGTRVHRGEMHLE